jgi:hypothetical protein
MWSCVFKVVDVLLGKIWPSFSSDLLEIEFLELLDRYSPGTNLKQKILRDRKLWGF